MDNKQLGELVNKAINGDNEAFEILLSEFEKFIYREAHRLEKSFPAEYGFDDLVQIGRMAVWAKLDKCELNKEYSLKSFFCTCIRWDMLQELQKTKTLKRKHYYESLSLNKELFEDGESIEYFLPDDNSMPVDDYLIQKEKLELIEDSKYNLSKKERKAFDLWSKGLEPKGISLIMNSTNYRVSNYLHKAKTKLRGNLENVPI
jgi:RNA polymerase sigma factor (sigma-70 family)